MDWKDVAGEIASYAPKLGTILGTITGGPAGTVIGGLAGTAIQSIAGLFGIKVPNPSADEVMDAIKKDPEAAMKLRMAEMQFALEMRRIDSEELKIGLADVQSARQRQVEHEKATGKTDINLYVLAWVIVGGFLGLTAALIYFASTGKPIADTTGVLYMLLGTLSTAFGMVVGYFFGTSLTSKKKDETFRALVVNNHKEK